MFIILDNICVSLKTIFYFFFFGGRQEIYKLQQIYKLCKSLRISATISIIEISPVQLQNSDSGSLADPVPISCENYSSTIRWISISTSTDAVCVCSWRTVILNFDGNIFSEWLPSRNGSAWGTMQCTFLAAINNSLLWYSKLPFSHIPPV